ncbi:HAD family hydrolase [Paenibacillus sp. IB182496]|uniref:HAD family hydrolase n=1 Tax=Paenibacillus sabuli TaxID=2772509 RepID=A0A927GVF2_9BACL|nr:HAD family hydrolase [Paenibacillus sabuli]MBD2848687.1 HAD family hydrolase [Paenibacillus sabuli]
MNIHAVIFDLDNTLINRKQAFKEFSNRLIEKYIIDLEPSERKDVLQYIIEADNDGYRSKKELYQELLSTLKWKKQETTIKELLDFWFSEFYKCSVLMEGAMDVLQSLKRQGLKLGLVTNGSAHSQNSKIDFVGLREHFDAIIVSDEVQVKKPAKRIFEITLDRLGVKPEFTIYVGDHPLNDVKGASDAGLKTIWLEGFRKWDVPETQPHYKISKLTEMIEMLEGGSKKSRNSR